MSELMNDVSKESIRSQMNLIFAMMRFLATVLDLAQNNEMVRSTLNSMSEGVLEQAAVLFRDVGEYITKLSATE